MTMGIFLIGKFSSKYWHNRCYKLYNYAEHFTVCFGKSSCPHDFLLANELIILTILTSKTGLRNIVYSTGLFRKVETSSLGFLSIFFSNLLLTLQKYVLNFFAISFELSIVLLSTMILFGQGT